MPVSVSEVMTLSESMSESVFEVHKNLVSKSESEVKIFSGSESTSELMSELGIHGPKRVDPGPNEQI